MASIIVDLLISIAPIPAPVGSAQALGVHQTLYMLFYVGAPIFVFVWVLLLYNVFVFRRGAVEGVDVPDHPDNRPVLLIWSALSFVVVIFLAGWGTFTLHEITKANGPHSFPIQVIGQQWEWTFRYPTYGGMETRELYVPVNQPITFNITSLDVVHSLWIYNYDIKEDAVPGVSNIAYMEAEHTGVTTASGKNWIVCNELCGLYHGYMRARLHVVTLAAFKAWAQKTEVAQVASGFLKNLPPYSTTYFPQPNFPSAPQDQSP
ncbi:MAG: cytochrome c oxidase subunit II [Chloroflexota bacterium]